MAGLPVDLTIPISGGAAAPSGSDISGGVKISPVMISNNSLLLPIMFLGLVIGGYVLWKKYKR